MLEKRRSFIINTVFWLLIAAIAYLALRLVLEALLPFAAGFAASALLYPPIRFLAERFGMKKKPAGIMLLLLLYATIGMLVTVLTVRLAVFIGELPTNMSGLYGEVLEPMLARALELANDAAETIDRFFGGEGRDTLSKLGEQLKLSLTKAMSELSVGLLSKLSGFAAAIPGVIVGSFFAVISSFFFTLEYERIVSLAKRLLPERMIRLLGEIKHRTASALGSWLGSYFLIMLITFAELALGFLLFGIEKPFVKAIIIALFDILPVLGTGGIMLPWAAVRFLIGDIGTALGLALLWGVIALVRNVIEPKIVGDRVGLHPLAALISIFVGAKLFGFGGMLMLPIGLAVAVPFIRDAMRERVKSGRSNGTDRTDSSSSNGSDRAGQS